MAKNQTVFVSADVLKTDADALAAIAKMTGYAPPRADLTLAKLQAAEKALKSASDEYAQTEAAWQAARDAVVTAQWDFHNAILGAKQQIVAQYGDDSDEAQAVGLKKKSERAKPPARAKPAPAK